MKESLTQNKEKTELSVIDSFEFKLSKPIGYGVGGKHVYTDKVKVVAPGEKLCIEAIKLEQMTLAAAIKSSALAAKFKKTKDSPEPDEEDEDKVKSAGKTGKMLMTASDINVSLGIEIFGDLAMAGCLIIQGNPVNPVQWNELSNYDKRDIFYQFIGVFILPSIS